jgi:hypothetical protein
MRYCHNCHKVTTGEPLFCHFCGFMGTDTRRNRSCFVMFVNKKMGTKSKI